MKAAGSSRNQGARKAFNMRAPSSPDCRAKPARYWLMPSCAAGFPVARDRKS
jgi:hypothetical protein